MVAVLEMSSILILCHVKGKYSANQFPFQKQENFRQDKVEGPCGNWYNETFLDTLNQPKAVPSAISSNRLASQENRRRPSRPALPRRQNVAQEQFPVEPLPQQLADLERFGQPKGK